MASIGRREFLASGVALGLSLTAGSSRLAGQEPDSTPAKAKKPSAWITPKTQQAINRGLAFLARRQVTRGRGRGSFGSAGATRYGSGVAVCALGGMAFMCSGSPPGEGPYGEHVDRCVDFIVRNTQESGFISTPGGIDRMYGHGFATLFLSQAYGMSMRPDVEAKLKKAVGLIVSTQNDAGGWRYQPIKSDADLSITICQIMALRAARDAGVYVPGETRRKCIEYVEKSQNADGGFRYQIGASHSSFPLTAAGVVSLYSANVYEGEKIEKGLKFLMKQIPGRGSTSGSYYFYSQYYAAQAMWHAGGTYWEQWYPAIRDTLLASQSDDGSWTDQTAGAEFGTAMGCIILQIPNDYLPVFGR